MRALLAPASHQETKIAVLAERGVMRAVEGNCQTPVAAYALREGSAIWLRALLAEPDGSNVRRDELRAPWPVSESDATRPRRTARPGAARPAAEFGRCAPAAEFGAD